MNTIPASLLVLTRTLFSKMELVCKVEGSSFVVIITVIIMVIITVNMVIIMVLCQVVRLSSLIPRDLGHAEQLLFSCLWLKVTPVKCLMLMLILSQKKVVFIGSIFSANF